MGGIFNGIATVIVGWMGVNKGAKLAEDWFQCGMSIFATAFVWFFGVFGAAGLASLKTGDAPLVALTIALCSGSGAMAVAVLALWKINRLTKGIPILAPMFLEQKVLETDSAYTEPNQSKENKP